MPPLSVLHITAHLGGGIGRVLSRLAQYRRQFRKPVQDIFLCLEKPENLQFVDIIEGCGANVVVCPSLSEARALIAAADIVQVEWWHHPLLPGFLCDVGRLNARVVIWCHVSGLFYPSVPASFLDFPDAFLFTTPVSTQCRHIAPIIAKMDSSRVGVVHSSGGFDDLPQVKCFQADGPLKCGYVGTYNFSKLHPRVTAFFEAAAHIPFRMDFYGDPAAAGALERKLDALDSLAGKVRLNGYLHNPGSVLADLDVFVYLLNPIHYGSTENALLEAMASGAVPIVLNNPVEKTIVHHQKTGFVVNTPDAFAAALKFCADYPDRRMQMSHACLSDIRERFSLQNTEKRLRTHYAALMKKPKQPYAFRTLFGDTPSEWFSFALGEYRRCFLPEYQGRPEYRRKRFSCPGFYEKTKSSVAHYFQYYPESVQLKTWMDLIKNDLDATGNDLDASKHAIGA